MGGKYRRNITRCASFARYVPCPSPYVPKSYRPHRANARRRALPQPCSHICMRREGRHIGDEEGGTQKTPSVLRDDCGDGGRLPDREVLLASCGPSLAASHLRPDRSKFPALCGLGAHHSEQHSGETPCQRRKDRNEPLERNK